MRIAVVVNTLKIGGMERVAVNLSDAFYEEGHDVELIYLRDKEIELLPNNKEIPIHLFNLKKEVQKNFLGFIWYMICKIFNLIYRSTFPIFFAYKEAPVFKEKIEKIENKNSSFDLIIFRGQGTFEHIWPIEDDRFVFVCENLQNEFKYKGLSKWVYSKIFKSRNVVCVSDGALDSFINMSRINKVDYMNVHRISNPNNYDKIRVNANTNNKVHNKPFILGLGRLVPAKNFNLLIEAYSYAIKKFNIIQDLLIVGSGQEENRLQKKVEELNLTNRVFFKGQKNNPFPWYKHADLFVLSSKFEGLGMVLIESLACDTKVVSTDSKGGVRQIMNGELEQFLAKENKESLGEKINFALNYKLNDKYNNSVKEILNNFDAKFIVSEYITHFKGKKSNAN